MIHLKDTIIIENNSFCVMGNEYVCTFSDQCHDFICQHDMPMISGHVHH